MNTTRFRLLALTIVCVFISRPADAYWEEQDLSDPIHTQESSSLTPTDPGYPYAFLSAVSTTANVACGQANVYTRAYYDGQYTGPPIDPTDPDPPDTSDQILETSGSAFGYGRETRSWKWEGSGSPLEDPFVVNRVLTVDARLHGDADNWSLSKGTVTLTTSATASVSLSTGPYKDMAYYGTKTYTEGDDWVPSGLSIIIGLNPAIRLTWDTTPGVLDDSFSDHEFRQTFFNACVTTDFAVLLSGTASVSEATSSNNADRASADIMASAGYY